MERYARDQQQGLQEAGSEDTMQDTTSPKANETAPPPPPPPSQGQELSAEERRQREEAESIELARMLMAEEAMASYQSSMDHLRDAADQLSPEDYAALQQVLAEEERQQEAEEVAEMEDDEGNLSYETMLELGERIGDVKAERWAMESGRHISRLPVEDYDADKPLPPDADDSEHKCLVCQCEYESADKLRRLPCNHCFHMECVDQWLQSKDVCPYCRVSILR